MEKNCKNCQKFFTCLNFVPFPERGCSEFVSVNKKKCLFGIFYYNTQTCHAKVLNIFDDERLAQAELIELRENLCKGQSSCIHIYIRPCSLTYAKVFADDFLMSIVNSVAQNLLIAERGFKKGNFNKEAFEKSARWFNFAHTACIRGAAILDVINND